MKKIKILFLFLLLVILCGAIAFSISPFMNVMKIEVRHVNSPLDVEIVEGLYEKNWLFTAEKDFEAMLLENYLIEEVQVKKSSLLTLDIRLNWRTPFVAFASGAFYVITDDEGMVLQVSQTPDAPYIIDGFRVISSIVGRQIDAQRTDLVESAVKFVYIFSKYAQENPEFDLQPDIVLVNGELIQRINSKFCINFGSGYDPEEQFVSAASIYLDMKKKRIDSGVINLSNPNQKLYEPWKEQY